MASRLREVLRKPYMWALPAVPAWLAWWWLSYRGPHRRKAGRASGPIPVPRVQGRSFDDLIRAGRPAIVTDIVPKWRASSWTPSTIADKVGDREVFVLRAGGPGDGFDTLTVNQMTKMTVREVVERSFGSKREEAKLYLAGSTCWSDWAPLTDDVDVPRLAKHEFANDGSSVWIGQQGNVTPLHYDGWHGFLVQIIGRKKLFMFPPEDGHLLRPTAPWAPRPAASSLPLLDSIGETSFPPAELHECVLEPGEMLFIPMYWWHEVVSLDATVSIPLRFNPRLPETIHAGTMPDLWRFTVGELASMVRAR